MMAKFRINTNKNNTLIKLYMHNDISMSFFIKEPDERWVITIYRDNHRIAKALNSGLFNPIKNYFLLKYKVKTHL